MILKILIVFLCATLTTSLYLKQAPTICYTPSCFNATDYIRSGLDESVNPCDDFYAFTCNNYIKEDIPEGYVYDEFTTISNDQSNKLITLFNGLTDKNNNSSKSKTAELVHRFQDGCIKSYGNKKLALDKAKEIFEEFGGWVAANEGDLPNVDWTEIVYKLFANGFSANLFFLSLSITHNIYDKEKHAINLSKPKVLSYPYILNEYLYRPHLQKYRNFIVELAIGMGATNVSYAEEEAKKIIELERKLSQINIEGKFDQISVRELQTKYSAISWKTYLSKMTNIDINDDDAVLSDTGEFLSKLSDILTTTSQRTLTSYVQYRTIAEFVRSVGFHPLYPISDKPDNDCRGLTNHYLPIAVSALYVRKYIPKEIKQQATEIVGKVKSTFMSIIQANEWADDATKDAAIKKIEHQYDLVAYPDELLDVKIVDKYYESVEYKEHYLEFILSISKNTNNAMYSKFRTVPKEDDWESNASVTEVNAYYNTLKNTIKILAGIISSPFYNPNFPNYMNFAAMGVTVGHEINHGLSGAGLEYDENGLKRFWASDQALAKLSETIDCLHSQYVQKHNEEAKAHLTSIEDQADATSIIAGYWAYQRWVQFHSDEGRLPSLEKYTPNQLFWISYGRFWCVAESEDYLKYFLPDISHSRNMYRVQIPLMNSEEFSKDFKCPSGSEMNPVKKCKIWN